MPARGFVFYTNFESAKGRELLASGKAALCFHWKSLRRQVRVRGHVSVVSDAEADAYFATRPRGSRLGAWASQQSRPLESRFALEKAVAAVTARYPIGEIPARPTGRASASRRSRSSSGTTAPSACTSASPSGAAAPASRGASSGSILEQSCVSCRRST